MARYIDLPQGGRVVVDDEDYQSLSRHRWNLVPAGRTSYARRRVTDALGKRLYVHMHREIIGCAADKVVDHINRDGLDNRKSNLRSCTRAENVCNRDAPRTRNKRSTFKGVHLVRDRFQARIQCRGISISLGYFDTEDEAARAYNAAAPGFHGEFAALNEGLK